MHRYMVVSDSHNPPTYLQKAARRFAAEQCTGLIHLGDMVEDARELARLTGAHLDLVAGNCDFLSREARLVTLEAEGVRMMLCHGDAYGVKYGYDRLSYAASELGAKIALFGHTHEAFCGFVGEVLLLNPGALKKGRYAILELDNGSFRPFLKTLVEKK